MRTAILAALLALASTGGARARNVLLFTIDSCRADRFGVLGREPSPTPRIFKVAWPSALARPRLSSGSPSGRFAGCFRASPMFGRAARS